MRSTRIVAGIIAAATVCAAVPVSAQMRPTGPPRPRPFVERGFITLGAAAQAAAANLRDQFSFESNAEAATVDASYPGRTGLLVEGAAGIRLRRSIGVAVAASRASRSGRASVTAALPHPFFDNRDRTVQGEADAISRTETAIHAQIYTDLRPRGRWRARLFAGPSYITVEQELVTEVRATETFPFDTAEFGSALTARADGSGIGFNAGVDLHRMLSRRVGAGVLVRYARANIDLNAPGARTVSTEGGGLQAGAGLRVLF